MTIKTRKPRELRHAMRRRSDFGNNPDRIIRVPLGPKQKIYAYLCYGARIGDLVEVHAPISGTVLAVVVGYGRGSWRGPLKRARLVRL